MKIEVKNTSGKSVGSIDLDDAVFGADGKTKSVAAALGVLGAGKKVLIVDAKTNANLVRGAKNLATSQWLAPEGINVYDIMRHDTLILTQAAVEQVVESAREKS